MKPDCGVAVPKILRHARRAGEYGHDERPFEDRRPDAVGSDGVIAMVDSKICLHTNAVAKRVA